MRDARPLGLLLTPKESDFTTQARSTQRRKFENILLLCVLCAFAVDISLVAAPGTEVTATGTIFRPDLLTVLTC